MVRIRPPNSLPRPILVNAIHSYMYRKSCQSRGGQHVYMVCRSQDMRKQLVYPGCGQLKRKHCPDIARQDQGMTFVSQGGSAPTLIVYTIVNKAETP